MKRSPIELVFDLPGHCPIVTGLFALADTHGFSLTDSILECRKRNIAPGFPAYVCDAVLAGWPVDRAIARVSEALRDCGENLPDLVEHGLRFAARTPDRWCSRSTAGRRH